MTTLGGYEPHEHAERLGIEIVYRRLTSANGLWVPDLHTIFLQPRMRAVHERSTLAHELGHACLGHRHSTGKHERQADIFAARHLINPQQLDYISRTSSDLNVWANEVGVTTRLLQTYLNHLAAEGSQWLALQKVKAHSSKQERAGAVTSQSTDSAATSPHPPKLKPH